MESTSTNEERIVNVLLDGNACEQKRRLMRTFLDWDFVSQVTDDSCVLHLHTHPRQRARNSEKSEVIVSHNQKRS